MVLLVQEPFPGYILWVIPVLVVAFYGLLIAVASSGARRSRRRKAAYGGRAGRPSVSRSSEDGDLWLAAYLSEAHREQYHGRR